MKTLTPDIIEKYKTYIKNNPALTKERNRQQYVAYVHIILTLFAVSFFGFFAIKPTVETIFNLQKQLEDSELVHQELQKKLQGLRALGEQYAQIQTSLESINAAVPASSEIPRLTRQVEQLAYAQQVAIQRIEVGQIEIYPSQKSTPPLYSFTFTLSLAGDPTNVQNFIYDLISFDRIVHLEKVTTGTVEEGASSSLVVGRAYFQARK